MNSPLLVIMAGGTGGHVFPGLAVAQHMRDKAWDVQWIGTADKMEAQLVPKHNITIHFINIGGVRGKSLLTKCLTPFKLLGALVQSFILLRKLNPSVVLGMGGYASGPGAIAAWLLNIPIVVHEQNAVFGMTNRYLAKISTYTLTGFDISAVTKTKHRIPKKIHYVGNPIRQGFYDINPKVVLGTHSSNEAPKKNINTPEQVQTENDETINILIVGGSLGALALNEIVPTVLSELDKSYTIKVVHQSGRNKHVQVQQAYDNIQNNVQVIEFIDDMEVVFDWADIIICRAGALTVAEVAGAGRVAIFVPLPIAVDDHQSANAQYLSDKGGALLIQQSQLATLLPNALVDLCSCASKRHTMAAIARTYAHENATEEVAKFIQQAANFIDTREAS